MAEEKADTSDKVVTDSDAETVAAREDRRSADTEPSAVESSAAGDPTSEAQATGEVPEAAAGAHATAEVAEEGEAGGESQDGQDLAIARDELERLHAEIEQSRDAALRAQAEAQNAKRRAEQDVEKARKFALERFCNELLPVVDNLERALDSASVDNELLKPIAEGVELTLKSLVDALRKFNVEAVDPHGEPFDPNLHQAMSLVENPEVDPNSVIAVMQKGYTLNGRLLRPAMVMVSKAPAA